MFSATQLLGDFIFEVMRYGLDMVKSVHYTGARMRVARARVGSGDQVT